MDRILERDVPVRAAPAAEGVRFEVGNAAACAVRNRERDVAVRVHSNKRPLRGVLERIPLVRGIARLFEAFFALFSGMNESQRLKPRAAYRGSAFIRGFARLFATSPQNLAAFATAIELIAILLGLMLALPMGVERMLLWIPGLPRIVINIVCCMFRLLGALLSVYFICRLKILRRMCMYRGAACKVINAYEAYGSGMTYETVLLSPRLTDRSDATFLLLTLLASIIAFACIRTQNALLQLPTRAGVILMLAALINEILLPLERACPAGRLSEAHRALTEIQQLFTLEPGSGMIEVALCAFQAANDFDQAAE